MHDVYTYTPNRELGWNINNYDHEGAYYSDSPCNIATITYLNLNDEFMTVSEENGFSLILSPHTVDHIGNFPVTVTQTDYTG